MKKRLCTLFLALLVLFALSLPAAAEEDGQTGDITIGHITDTVGLLSEEELQTLEGRAESIAEQYQFNVNIVVVQRYQDYNDYSVYEAAKTIYRDWSLGYGDAQDGVLLLLSMEERDYANIAYGYGNTAFTDYGKEKLDEQFLDNFRENDWYGGFSDYLKVSEKYLSMARDGKPFDTNTDRGVVGILIAVGIRVGIPLIIALIYVAMLRSDMKSVEAATDAGEYIDENSFHLTEKKDVFTHTTRTERKIEREKSSGGGTHVDSGGFSGTSGKF